MLSKQTKDKIRKEAKEYAPTNNDLRLAYKAGSETWAVWKEKAEGLAEALEYLMDGVSGLPPLTAIEGVLIPHWEKATAALESFNQNKVK